MRSFSRGRGEEKEKFEEEETGERRKIRECEAGFLSSERRVERKKKEGVREDAC